MFFILEKGYLLIEILYPLISKKITYSPLLKIIGGILRDVILIKAMSSKEKANFYKRVDK